MNKFAEPITNELASEMSDEFYSEMAIHNYLLDAFEEIKGRELTNGETVIVFNTPLSFFKFIHESVTNSLIHIARIEAEDAPTDNK